jgi:outer membrane PBP1 activator LpoA protein
MAGYYAQAAGARPQVRIYDVGADATGVYNQAIQEGASFIVGPLTKEDVAAVARLNSDRVTTLALNNLPAGDLAPPRFYQFALAPEDEAAQVARRLLAEGRTTGIALVPQGEWGARVLSAFNATLGAGGGRLVGTRTFAPNTMDYSDPIVALLGFDESKARHQRLVQTLGMTFEFSPRRRSDIQFVFVGAQPTQGRLIRPQLKFHYAGDLPMYATSDIFDANPNANLDLDDVRFPQMPWLATPDAAIIDVREEVRTLWPDRDRRRGRLYAMGFDAYRLVAELGNSSTPLREPIAGMTGRLSLGDDRQIHRTLEWVELQDGQMRTLPPVADAY